MSDVPFVHSVTIRFGDCDPAGIVYYPNFFDMFETALETWLLDAIGESYREWIMVERRALPRVRVTCEFSSTCAMGDRLDLAVLVTRVGRSSIGIDLVGTVGGEERLRGSVVLVHMSLDTGKSLPLPDGMRARLEAYREACGNPAG